MTDVATNNDSVSFRVLCAPTGSGKSTSAAALIASGVRTIPGFSAAFITETVKQADDTGALIAKLIGADAVTVWSSAHDSEATEVQRAATQAEYGPLEMRPSRRSDLTDARVVVVTHRLWLNEMAKKLEGGARFFRGKRRSVVFVDEHPSLVKMVERTPGDLIKLRDHLLQVDQEDPRIEVLERVAAVADKEFKAPDGSAYAPLRLVDEEDKPLFSSDSGAMFDYADPAMTASKALPLPEIQQTLRFMSAASKGCLFISRSGGTSLVSYEAEYEPGPGHVLLDATADITGMAAYLPGMDDVSVPAVDYRNLSVHHMQHPKEFQRASEVLRRATTARPYAEWIRGQVIENTEAGDTALVVAHKGLFDHEYLERAEDPKTPAVWDGRQVVTCHWGMGIGSNLYRSIENVFLFGEFFIPRSAVISNVYGWSGGTPTAKQLADASRPHEPGGAFLSAYKGHLLRWTKQLASRGAVRNIDAEGHCGSMRLFTSMKLGRLLRYFADLFPGAELPILLGASDTLRGDQLTGPEKLVELLISTEEKILPSDRVEVLTGVRADSLNQAISRNPAVSKAIELGGWEIASSSSVGLPGKRKVLARLAA